MSRLYDRYSPGDRTISGDGHTFLYAHSGPCDRTSRFTCRGCIVRCQCAIQRTAQDSKPHAHHQMAARDGERESTVLSQTADLTKHTFSRQHNATLDSSLDTATTAQQQPFEITIAVNGRVVLRPPVGPHPPTTRQPSAIPAEKHQCSSPPRPVRHRPSRRRRRRHDGHLKRRSVASRTPCRRHPEARLRCWAATRLGCET